MRQGLSQSSSDAHVQAPHCAGSLRLIFASVLTTSKWSPRPKARDQRKGGVFQKNETAKVYRAFTLAAKPYLPDFQDTTAGGSSRRAICSSIYSCTTAALLLAPSVQYLQWPSPTPGFFWHIMDEDRRLKQEMGMPQYGKQALPLAPTPRPPHACGATASFSTTAQPFIPVLNLFLGHHCHAHLRGVFFLKKWVSRSSLAQ